MNTIQADDHSNIKNVMTFKIMGGKRHKRDGEFILLINNFEFFLCITIISINFFGIFLRKNLKKNYFLKMGEILKIMIGHIILQL